MASRKAALKALLVTTLVSALLVQGGALDLDYRCCYCGCYHRCLNNGGHPDNCRSHCVNVECPVKCDGRYRCPKSDDLVSRVMDVAVAAGGGGLDKGNGTETGAAAAPSMRALVGRTG